MVWGSPRSRNIPPNVPFKRGYYWLVQLLKASGELAEERGLKIAIEPINRFESKIIHTAREALSLARLVGLNSVGIVYDVFHVSLEEESFTAPILLAERGWLPYTFQTVTDVSPERVTLTFDLYSVL